MSETKEIKCVICDYGGTHMFIPNNDETRGKLKYLWDIYHKLIKVVPPGPAACYLDDFSHRDNFVFYSFCDFCRPHVNRLCDLYKKMDKQVQLIYAIPTYPTDTLNNVNSSDLSQMDLNGSTSGSPGNQRKRMKLTNVANESDSSTSSQDSGSDSSDNTDSADDDDDEIAILEENACVQNQNAQLVSIDIENAEEENNTELIIKKLDDSESEYLFEFKGKTIYFARSICSLKFNCSLCSTQAQNITEIISHIWTVHCEDGRVKSLPNYRIDNYVAANNAPSLERENMTVVENSSSSPQPEIKYNDDSSSLLSRLRGKSVYYDRELVFNPSKEGRYRCSYCSSIVDKEEIVSHTATCLPEKRKRKESGKPQLQQPPAAEPQLRFMNGWPYYKITNRKFKCAFETCQIGCKRRLQLFDHLRSFHAGVDGGFRNCPHCDSSSFPEANALWNHIYEKHKITHLKAEVLTAEQN